ncbi:MAG TPA: energy transducer TonB [Pyrinomonadaceae bacterium]|nr:energy transducer TonB [Pyrinomonadaceae bacterium]
MNIALVAALILVFSVASFAQSGRRAKAPPAPTPSPSPQEQPTSTAPAKQPEPLSQVTAEKNQDYRCTDDGTLAHIIDAEVGDDKGFSPKEVDVKPTILAKPNPNYTRAAREAGVQGYVVLKVLLSAKGDIDRVRVVRRLPYGLTENGIQAACKIQFKPALKGGQPVAMWLNVEYVYRLANSSIYGP